MKADGLLIGIGCALLVIGGIVGYAMCEWTTPDPPEHVSVPQTQTHQVPDTAGRAALYASAFSDGRASVRPIIRTVTVAGATHTEVVYDSTALAAALEAYAIIDSLIGTINTVQDLIAHTVMDVPDHRLELFYRIREKSFRGTTITCTRPDSLERIEVEKPTTWWDHWSLGVSAGPSVVYVPHDGLKAGIGLTIGLQYEF